LRQPTSGTPTGKSALVKNAWPRTFLPRWHPPAVGRVDADGSVWYVWPCGARFTVTADYPFPRPTWRRRLKARVEEVLAMVFGTRIAGKRWTLCRKCRIYGRRGPWAVVLALVAMDPADRLLFAYHFMQLYSERFREAAVDGGDLTMFLPDWPFGLAKATDGQEYIAIKDGLPATLTSLPPISLPDLPG